MNIEPANHEKPDNGGDEDKISHKLNLPRRYPGSSRPILLVKIGREDVNELLRLRNEFHSWTPSLIALIIEIRQPKILENDMGIWNNLKGATKSPKDNWIGGVCGGLGRATSLPSWMWRVIFLLSAFAFGVGLLFYVVLWICMPSEKMEVHVTLPGVEVERKNRTVRQRL